MSTNNSDGPKGVLVGAKRVRRVEADARGREQIVLTFGPDKQGRDSALELAQAITDLVNEGKQINFDVRLDKKQTERGKSFDVAFVIIKEMVPKDAEVGGGKSPKFTPKPSRAQTLKKTADQIRREVEG